MGLNFRDPSKSGNVTEDSVSIPIGGLNRGVSNIKNFFPNLAKKAVIKGVLSSNTNDENLIGAIEKGVDDFYKPDVKLNFNQVYDPSEEISNSKGAINSDIMETLSNDQKELWERENEIRKHVEDREDSAYQRAVADMKKAGINPELLGVNPASSGGGITSASRLDSSLLNTDLSGAYSQLIAQINNEVKVDENKKDRILSILNNFVDSVGKIFLFKFLKM